MVLHGNEEGLAPPFDSSLYGASLSPTNPGTEFEIEYEGCESVTALFTTTPDVEEILPEGVAPFSSPPTAAVLMAHYPFSTVGEYHEFITLVQVEDLDGEMAYYIPYIYVTNDAALAAGREWAGAPKKLAAIDVDTTGTIIEGTLARPDHESLVSLTVKPERRAEGGFVDSLMSDRMPLLSIRHLPPIEGGDGCTQLVKWYAEMDFEADQHDRPKRWMGPSDLDYVGRSVHDPVHKVSVDDLLAGVYAKYDMVLGVTEVQKTWEL